MTTVFQLHTNNYTWLSIEVAKNYKSQVLVFKDGVLNFLNDALAEHTYAGARYNDIKNAIESNEANFYLNVKNQIFETIQYLTTQKNKKDNTDLKNQLETKINQLENYKTELKEQKSGLIKLFKNSTKDLEEQKVNFDGEIDRQQELLEVRKKEFEDKTAKIQLQFDESIKTLIDKNEKEAGNKIAEKYKNEFKADEAKYQKSSDTWKWGTVFSILILIHAVIAQFWLILNNMQVVKELGIVYTSSSVLLFSILSYMAFLCNRNFSNNQHLAYIYKQKHTMLATYMAFLGTVAGDPEVRHKLAGELGKIIFAVEDTGYIKPGTEMTTSLIANLEGLGRKIG